MKINVELNLGLNEVKTFIGKIITIEKIELNLAN